MARGNFRAGPSWGCTYCGKFSRDESHKLQARGKGANKSYLCPEHCEQYDKKQKEKKQ